MTRPMIVTKNKMLKEAGQKLHEVWDIACMLENVNLNKRDYQTLISLVSHRLTHIACGYDEYLEECELYLPEAEEADPEEDPFLELPEDEEELFAVPIEDQPTEEEMAKAREVFGDD